MIGEPMNGKPKTKVPEVLVAGVWVRGEAALFDRRTGIYRVYFANGDVAKFFKHEVRFQHVLVFPEDSES